MSFSTKGGIMNGFFSTLDKMLTAVFRYALGKGELPVFRFALVCGLIIYSGDLEKAVPMAILFKLIEVATAIPVVAASAFDEMPDSANNYWIISRGLAGTLLALYALALVASGLLNTTVHEETFSVMEPGNLVTVIFGLAMGVSLLLILVMWFVEIADWILENRSRIGRAFSNFYAACFDLQPAAGLWV